MITVKDYILNSRFTAPCFVQGDSLKVLSTLPNNCIDCVVTSPPYYMKRQYLAGGIGLEATYDEYIENLLAITREIHRVLKPTGSFWLNIGDMILKRVNRNSIFHFIHELARIPKASQNVLALTLKARLSCRI